MLKRVKKYWIYIVAIVAGVALTPCAITAAVAERGYGGAIGGEYLIVPLFLLITTLVDGVARTLKESGMEVQDNESKSQIKTSSGGF